MNETNITRFKKSALALAVASSLSLSPWIAEAASLGRLTVLSGLGQPLRAELDLGAGPDELSGMSARLAPQEAFKQAGIEYMQALSDLRFTLDKRPNGSSVIRVSSAKPVNEPFLDFLVELNWPSGRLVREYTFLLDPPDMAEKQAERSAVDARVVESVRGGGESQAAPRPTARAAAKPATEPSKAAAGETRVVQRGETLRKVAGETQYDGVSLEQMLVGLFRSNPDAFIGSNLHRLKSGAILNLPDKETVASVSAGEAKKIYVSQTRDWNAYRQKLAAATAKGAAKEEDAAAQAAAGKISAKVEEKAAPAEKTKDQVKVARADATARGADAARSAGEEERIAREKAYKEAQERLVTLEKNVNDLQKLLDLKSQKLAELQQSSAKKEEAKAPPEAAKPVPEPAKVEAPVAPPESKQAEAPKAAEEVKPVEPPPPPPPKPAPKKPAPPPPPPEPDLLDSLLADPLPLAAGGGLLAALLAFLFVKRRRASGGAAATTTAAPVSSGIGPNSVFRMTGGQSIDTGNTPPQTGDFSQTGPGTIDTDEVDPVAEADVYMAYGRDTQAEEILLEALQKDPQRTAIHAKLLEIYANRGSLKQFETLASELYAQTAGNGPDWAKVAELGARLDPKNPLYAAGRAAAAETPAAAAPMATPEPTMPIAEPAAPVFTAPELPPAEVEEETPAASAALDFDLGEAAQGPGASAAGGYVDTSAGEAEPNVLDFDLGAELAPEPSAEPEPVEPLPELTAVEEAPAALDFDLGAAPAAEVPRAAAPIPEEDEEFSPEATLVMPMSAFDDSDAGLEIEGFEMPAPKAAPAVAEPTTAPSPLDFDFAMPQAEPAPAEPAPAAPEVATAKDDELDDTRFASTLIEVAPLGDEGEFDPSLGDSAMPAPEFDLGAINLDLTAEPAPAGEGARDQRWEEVNTKLDLAKAYEEMGDLEGARELLEEVVAEGVADLAEQAKAILDRLNG